MALLLWAPTLLMLLFLCLHSQCDTFSCHIKCQPAEKEGRNRSLQRPSWKNSYISPILYLIGHIVNLVFVVSGGHSRYPKNRLHIPVLKALGSEMFQLSYFLSHFWNVT